MVFQYNKAMPDVLVSTVACLGVRVDATPTKLGTIYDCDEGCLWGAEKNGAVLGGSADLVCGLRFR